mgnify:CR=1 FL=1
MLSRGATDWRDGSEDRLLEIISAARDLSSLSDELEQAATNWPERYHLTKSRANVLRPLPLGREMTVLEVGAGCGALTRYLGETCGVVDALEPVLERARVARARTRDLDNVEVFVGEVDDIPAGAVYDLVVVVGVLEYVGRGSGDPEPYVRFLSQLAGLLSPGGHLVCAIENRLGVKYLAGAPEDHTARPFDGLEGYPRDGPARTFAREELVALLEAAGLRPTFFHAFPDYKLARAVFSDSLLESPEDRSLAWRLPHFPSPDWSVARPRLADERSLWKSVVEAGLGAHLSNSFVIVAATGSEQVLWPTDQLASFYNCQRRALFATETRLRRTPSGLHFQRSPLARRESSIECGPLVHELSDSEFVPGTDMTDILATAGEGEVREWLQRWRELVSRESSNAERTGVISIDLLPHNIVVRDNDDLAVIDQEWWHRDYTDREVTERGILWLAEIIADRSPPERWGAERVGELAVALGANVGLDPEGVWLPAAVEREAALQAQVHESGPDDPRWEPALGVYRAITQEKLNRRLADAPLGMREHEMRARLEAHLEEARGQLSSLQAETAAGLAVKDALLAEKDASLAEMDAQVTRTEATLAETEQQLREVQQQFQAATSTLGYRLLERTRAVINRIAPPGTRRRAVLKLFRKGLRIILTEGWGTFLRRGVQVWRWVPRLIRRARLAASVGSLDEQYQLWLQAHALTPAQVRRTRKEAARLSYRPKVSIIMPAYNSDPAWLREAIESVRGQLYDNWEMCIADDASSEPAVRELLQEYEGDERIKVTYLKENRGISGASNAALAMATGEYIGFLDHDDELKPHALYEVVKLLNERPDLDFIYSDEDKRSPDGRLVQPFFKPDWSPDLLLSTNYVPHFAVYRKRIVDDVGGLRSECDFSQDHDLALRVTERTNRIGHVALPLYTWRMVPGSAALELGAKPKSIKAAKRALADAMQRRGIEAKGIEGPFSNTYRVRYRIQGRPLVSIIVPTRDRVGLLRSCIGSIEKKSKYANYEIIIVDNDSQEEATRRYLASSPHRTLSYPGEFHYGAMMNFAIAEAAGDYVLLLNNDTEVISEEWIEAMLEHAQRPEVAAVGAHLLYPNGSPQHQGVVMGVGGGSCLNVDTRDYFGLGRLVRNVSAVTAACMMTRRQVFAELGCFDEGLKVAFHDVDYCLRARENGYAIVYTPFASLYHHESASRGALHPQEDELFFRRRWGEPGEYRDPYYNPNLSRLQPFTINTAESDSSPSAGVAVTVSRPVEDLLVEDLLEVNGVSEELPYKAKLDEAGRLGRVLRREDIYLSGYDTGPPVDAVHEELFEFIAGVSGHRVLDIGCGIAPYAARLNQRGADCIGVEINQEVVSAAGAIGRPVFLMDGRALAFRDAAFDTCLLIEAIEHIDDFELVLREAARVTRRNIVISVPNIAGMPFLFRHNVVPWHMLENTHVNFFTPEILQRVLERIFSGQAEVRVEPYAPVFPWAEGVQLYYHIRAVVELAP